MDQESPRIGWQAAAQNSKSAPGIALAPGEAPVVTPRFFALDLPGGMAFIPLITLGFVCVATVISISIGTRFTLPQSGNIPGLHTNYWVPPIAAVIGYLLLQCAARLLGRNKRAWREIARHATTDYLLLGLFILVIYIHFNIKMWVPLINPHQFDAAYFAADQALHPVMALFAAIRNGVATILPATDIWYQAAFFAIFVLSFLSHALGSRRYHYHNMAGLLLIEMVGPLTYLIAPAVGPFIYEQGPNTLATNAELKMYDVYQHVREGGAAWISQHGGSFFAEPLAAMPSLHVGATLVIVYYAIKGRLWSAPISVIAFLWIFIESVVARWHYLVDLPAGIALAIGVIVFVNWLCRDAVAAADKSDGNSGAGRNDQPAASLVARNNVPAERIAAERSAGDDAGSEPRVWVMQCHRAGDHNQSLALAQALGWPFEVKKTVFRWYEAIFALFSWPSMAGLDKSRSSAFAAPWPDLIILAGRQNEIPARWIREQSGGRTRVVVIGRNWTPAAELDCLITTPQFRLPRHPNTLLNLCPLHLATRARMEQAAEIVRPRLAGLPGPYLALMVGGSSGPYVFSRETARRLGREASALARKLGASLLVSTSARTGWRATEALENALDVPYQIYRYQPNDDENPHLGFLGLADAVIVTGDSLSMMTEACDTLRPVYLFEFGAGPAAMRGPRSADPRLTQWWRWPQLKDQGVLGLPYAFWIQGRAWRLNRSRDLRLVQDEMIASGRARWLNDPNPEPFRPAPLEDLDRAAKRVRGLILSPPSPLALRGEEPAGPLAGKGRTGAGQPA